MKKYLIIAILFLAACASTPKSDVAAIEVSLTGYDNLLLKYDTYPVCGAGVSGICKSLTIESNARKAAIAAYAAVMVAKASENTADIAAAQKAIASLSSLVTSLGVQ